MPRLETFTRTPGATLIDLRIRNPPTAGVYSADPAMSCGYKALLQTVPNAPGSWSLIACRRGGRDPRRQQRLLRRAHQAGAADYPSRLDRIHDRKLARMPVNR